MLAASPIVAGVERVAVVVALAVAVLAASPSVAGVERVAVVVGVAVV